MYEVPEELKYEERIIWLFTFKQAVLFSAFAMLAVLLFTRTNLDFKLKVVSCSVILLSGFAVSTIKPVQEELLKRAKYVIAPKKGSWNDSDTLDRYVGIKNIKEGAVLMQDEKLLSVLLLTPIDFSVLSDEQKMSLIYSYRSFLNSLSFPVQIVMRTTKVNLQEYFSKAKEQMALKRDRKAINEMQKFEEFIEEFISSRGVNDRLFYLVILQEKTPNEEESLRQLRNKVSICREKLNNSGIITKELSDNSLISLYASFFGGYVEVGADYLSLLTLLDFSNEEYEKLNSAGKKVEEKMKLLNYWEG